MMDNDTRVGMEVVLADVRKERRSQESKWGRQSHNVFVWLAILGEEIGEASEAALEHRLNRADGENVRDELIQVAAVAVAMVEALDRGETP